MRRPAAIILVLMGGGLALWSVNPGPSRACMDARAQQRPDAEAICRTSSGGSSHSSSGSHGGTSSGSATAASAIARGGFGAAGAHAAGS